MNKFLKLAYDYGCKQAALEASHLLPLLGAASGGYAGSQYEDHPLAGGVAGALLGGAAGHGLRGVGRDWVKNLVGKNHGAQLNALEDAIKAEAPAVARQRLLQRHERDAARLSRAAELVGTDNADIAQHLNQLASELGDHKARYAKEFPEALQDYYKNDGAAKLKELAEAQERHLANAEAARIYGLGAGLTGVGGLSSYALSDN